MKKIAFLLALLMLLSVSTTGFSYAVCTYHNYTGLSVNSVILYGEFYIVHEEGGPPSQDQLWYFEYWEDGSDVIHQTPITYIWITDGQGTACLENLKPGTTYHYRANGSDEIVTFTTLTTPESKTTTVLTKRDDEYVFAVRPQCLDTAKQDYYISLYKDGEYVSTITGDSKLEVLELKTKTDFDYAKVFVWDKDSLEPITAPEIVYNN